MTGGETTTDVVIGAGSGMGAAAAALLAAEGRRLVLADRDPEAAAAVAATLPGGPTAVACDITDTAAVAELVATVGPLGRLILTAGLSPQMTDGRRIYDVNLVATEALLEAFEPSIVPGSAAVVLASRAAHQIPPDAAIDALLDDPASDATIEAIAGMGLLDHSGIAYAVSKRGVIRLVERRARAWGAAGGRLVSVSPGVIDTPMGRLEAANTPEMAPMVSGSALAREGRAEEVAAVAVFLASEAASFVTGTDVLVDGGCIAAQHHNNGG